MLQFRGAVFIDIPKCGTTSVRKAAAKAGLDEQYYRAWTWHSREIPDEIAHLPRYSIVRDPYARALSLFYFERRQCEMKRKQWYPGGSQAFWNRWALVSLETFLLRCIENRETQEWPNVLPCALFLAPCEPVEALHLENISSEWKDTALPPLAIPHERRGSYSHTWNSRQVALVEEWAAEDFERYGYART